MLSNIILKNSSNIAKTGLLVVLSTLAQQLVREQSNQTLSTAAKSVRRIRTEISERKALGES